MNIKNPRDLIDAFWRAIQPLTLKPKPPLHSVSDLFIWRNSSKWETFFELIDIGSLFSEKKIANSFIIMIFFDKNGKFLFDKNLEITPCSRTICNISLLLANKYGEEGTFAIIHPDPPDIITNLGSQLAERGYVSYCYENSPLRSYVHGNLDAIALGLGRAIQMLGGGSFFTREYHLQYELNGDCQYEIAFINACNSTKKVEFLILSKDNKNYISKITYVLSPRELCLVPISVMNFDSYRLIIKSKIVMARPVIFKIQKLKMNVFHG